ncbi:MAG: hypothetical protein ABIG11_07295 [bacterium]
MKKGIVILTTVAVSSLVAAKVHAGGLEAMKIDSGKKFGEFSSVSGKGSVIVPVSAERAMQMSEAEVAAATADKQALSLTSKVPLLKRQGYNHGYNHGHNNGHNNGHNHGYNYGHGQGHYSWGYGWAGQPRGTFLGGCGALFVLGAAVAMTGAAPVGAALIGLAAVCALVGALIRK